MNQSKIELWLSAIGCVIVMFFAVTILLKYGKDIYLSIYGLIEHLVT